MQHPHGHDPAGQVGGRAARTTAYVDERRSTTRPPPAAVARRAASRRSRQYVDTVPEPGQRRRRRRAGRPGSGRPGAAARTGRGDRQPATSPGAARRRSSDGEVEGLVEHAGVDPVGPRGRRRRAAAALRATSVGLGAARARAPAAAAAGSSVVHRATRASSTSRAVRLEPGEATARPRSSGLPRAGSGLALATGGSRISTRATLCWPEPTDARGGPAVPRRVVQGAARRRRHAARRASPRSSTSSGSTPEFPAEVERGRAAGGRQPAAARPRPHRHPVRDHRPGRRRWTSTRRCTSSATATATSCTTRSPTWPRSSRPGDPVDARGAPARRDAVRRRTRKIPLHPPVLSEGAALAAARPGPARRCCGRSRSTPTARAPTSTCERALVRSRAKLDYDGVQQQTSTPARADEALALLARGRRAAACSARPPAAGCRCRCPSRRSTSTATGGRWRSARMLPVEEWNAQISLLTGMAAASLMVYARVGLLRTLPPPDPRDVQRLHRTAKALRHRLARRAALPRLHPLASTPTSPSHAAMLVGLHPAAARRRATSAFDGEVPEQPRARRARLGVRPRHRAAAPARRPVRRRGLRRAVRRHRGAGWVLERLAAAARRRCRRSGRRAHQLRARRARPGRGRGAARRTSARRSPASSSRWTRRTRSGGDVRRAATRRSRRRVRSRRRDLPLGDGRAASGWSRPTSHPHRCASSRLSLERPLRLVARRG